MSLWKKILLVIIIIIFLIIALLIFGYYYTTGFTKKQQYYKCADVCKQMMIFEADIPICKLKCEQVSGYKPPVEKKENKAKSVAKPTEKTETVKEQPKLIGDYYCSWSWPQVIIKKSTKEDVFRCTDERPWCDFADGTYEKVGCCKNYDGETKQKTDCITLPDLLNESKT